MESTTTDALTVLLVEDEPANRTLLQGLLSKSSLPISEITTAESLAGALDLLDRKRFDVLLLDLNLPDSEGLETLAKISEKHPGVASVVITGAYGEDLGLKAVKQGAQEYLLKGSYNTQTLSKSIRYAVERKRSELMLREANEFRERVMESISNAIYVTDADGRFRFVNRAGLEISGYRVEELMGQSFSILFRAETLGEFREQLDKATADGNVVPHFEMEIVRKDGSIAFVNLSLSPLFEHGRVMNVVWTAQDVTERKRIYEILDRKQKNLEAIFDAAPVGMMLIDENREVCRVNDDIRQMVSKGYIEIINRRIGDALGCVNSTYSEQGCEFSPACGTCLFQQTIRTVLDSEQGIHKVEIQPTFKKGNDEIKPWLCISAEPAMIDGHRHVVVAIDDITERKRAEEELKETMKLKSQFISTVSHELRTPLTSLKEGVAIVLEEVVGKINEKQRNFLDIAKRNIDRLARLINDVLDFQKLEGGKMTFNMHENDIRQVTEDVYATMLSFANSKGVNLSVEVDGELPKATFDSDKIIQALTNLVSNAIKFTPENGQVSIGVQRWREEMAIRVKDSGMGIPPEDLQKIFDRFYRVHRPGKEIQGTGLGLPIVRDIVTMHGGRIEVESEVDRGTTFTVFLPIEAGSAPGASSKETNKLPQEAAAEN